MTRLLILALGTMLAAVCDLPAAADEVRFVRADAPPGGNGLGWTTAYNDLQDALDDAAADPTISEIWVAAGTYRPDGGLAVRDASFGLVAGVEVLGGFAGDETSRDQRDPASNHTMLSGDLNGDDAPGFANISDNSRHVVSAIGLAAPAVLDGVTVTGGNADFPGEELTGGGGLIIEDGEVHVTDCRFQANSAGQNMPDLGGFGGAIFLDVGELVIRDSSFAGNRATNGGALGIFEGRLDVADCAFTDNAAPHQVGGVMWAASDTEIGYTRCSFTDNSAQYAGALFTVLSLDVDVIECDFTGNHAAVQAGACWFQRSDSNDTVTTIIERCAFVGNAAGTSGCLILEENDTLVKDCVFLGNASLRNDSSAGALLSLFDDLEVINGVFSGNRAATGGAIALFRNDVARITNSTLAGNVALFANAGAGIRVERTALTLDNGILWDNTAGGVQNEQAQIALFNGSVSVNFSDLEGLTGGLGGTGNIDSDPLFADALGPDGLAGTPDDDLHVTTGSPAIDAANNAALPGAVTQDADGNPRFVDDPDTPDTGAGTPPIVDMGAYEFQPFSAETVCPDDPADFLKSLGGPVTGDALDLCASDDVRMEVLQSARLSPLLPFIRLEYWAHSSLADTPITSVTYTVEGHVSALVAGGQNPDTLRTSIRNYSTGLFELIDQRGTTANADETIGHVQVTRAPDYVNAGDGEVRVRQDVLDPGNVFSPNWFLKVDLYEVTVGK